MWGQHFLVDIAHGTQITLAERDTLNRDLTCHHVFLRLRRRNLVETLLDLAHVFAQLATKCGPVS